MKLSTFFTAALAVVVNAKVEFTNSAFDVEAGQPFALTWSGASGPVTITLMDGSPSDLQTVEVIDQNDSSSTFTWTPPATLPSGTYAFKIEDSTDTPNYSVQFSFVQTSASASASGTTSGSAVTSGSATTTAASATTSGATTTKTTSSSSMTSGSTSSSKSSSTKSSSTSSSSSTGASTSTTSAPTNTNDGLRAKSPLALVLVTVVALLYFN